jgi:hypothetical protein
MASLPSAKRPGQNQVMGREVIWLTDWSCTESTPQREREKRGPIYIILLYTNKRQVYKLSHQIPNTLAPGRRAGKNR